MKNQNETTAKASTTPDFSHRCADYPHIEIINATSQIDTVLSFLYGALERAEALPPAACCTVERLIDDKKMLIDCVNDALHIIYNLNRDVKAIAQTITTAE
jgi:hypothetical protein